MLEYRCCTRSGYFSIDVVHYVLVGYHEQTVAIVKSSHVEQGLDFE